MNTRSQHINPESTLAEIVENPAFDGSGELLLPWYARREDLSTPFRAVDAYFPYHSAFNTKSMLDALNRLIDDHAAGGQVFYPIYSEEEMRADPSKHMTGLFFFRGQADAPFAIISPGGGFAYVGSLHESLPHANELCRRGYNAFSLAYRAGSGDLAVQDLAAALVFVFGHAAELKVSTQGYSLWGSSAGARMASAVGTYGTAAFGFEALPQPAVIIMAYTGQSNYTAYDPPTFSVVGDRDGIAPTRVMKRRVEQLRAAGVPALIEIFPDVGHGFGLGIGTAAEGWIDDAIAFWEEQRNERNRS